MTVRRSGISRKRPIVIINDRWVRPVDIYFTSGAMSTMGGWLGLVVDRQVEYELPNGERYLVTHLIMEGVEARPSGRLIYRIDGVEHFIGISTGGE